MSQVRELFDLFQFDLSLSVWKYLFLILVIVSPIVTIVMKRWLLAIITTLTAATSSGIVSYTYLMGVDFGEVSDILMYTFYGANIITVSCLLYAIALHLFSEE